MRTRFAVSASGVLSAALAMHFFAAGSLFAEVATPPAAPSTIYAAYVLLAESPSGRTVAFARVIVDPGAPCPQLVGAGKERIATTPRRNPHGFAVKVCEARYPFGRSLSVAGGPRLPVAKVAPTRVAVLGDSGCEPKDQAGCSLDDPQWPFPTLAKAAAAGPGRRQLAGVVVGFLSTRGRSVDRCALGLLPRQPRAMQPWGAGLGSISSIPARTWRAAANSSPARRRMGKALPCRIFGGGRWSRPTRLPGRRISPPAPRRSSL